MSSQTSCVPALSSQDVSNETHIENNFFPIWTEVIFLYDVGFVVIDGKIDIRIPFWDCMGSDGGYPL
jgi:hypothetical protein